jgi:RHS repeat-associated protein
MNPNQTTQVMQYDTLLRATAITLPNTSQATYSYSPGLTVAQQTIGNGNSTWSATQYDGYGRKSRLYVSNGQSGNLFYQTDYCYDATGLLQFQSLPYQGSGVDMPKVCSGSGTSYTYDALGRLTGSTNADGIAVTQYFGRAVEQTDVNGVSRITQYDPLGRITEVCEISAQLPSGDNPSPCLTDLGGTGFLTSYAYDMPNHKVTISQGTTQKRVFQTDAAGRVIYTNEPERGITTYSYVYNGTGLQVTRTRPQANQTSAGVMTTTKTQYDSLGRPVSVIYSDGTPQRNYIYDAFTGWTNFTQQNLLGMLAFASSSIAPGYEGTAYSYDLMGNVVNLGKCQPSGCGNSAYDKHLLYTYDLLGNVISSTDGGGVTITNTYSPASEIQSITSSLSDSGDPASLISNVVNGPFGPTGYQRGNGLTSVLAYDSLGRKNAEWACQGSSQSGCTGGSQIFVAFESRQGSRVISSGDSVEANWSSYGYDTLNRLNSVSITAGSGTSFSYVYDRFGNRLSQTVTQVGAAPQPQLTFSPATNQITYQGFSYDAAGNMTSDGTNTYQYDAQGNMIASNSGTKYDYDALNEQIRLTTSGAQAESVFDPWGKMVSVWEANSLNNAQGNHEVIATAYWGATPIESYLPGSGVSHFRYRDWTGSLRLETDGIGNVTLNRVSLPFGDGASNISGSRDSSYDGFAGYWDGATAATNHAPFREYSNLAGRWMSPDPYDGSYDISDPQSLNRYSYVQNNPLTSIDPSGLFRYTFGPGGTGVGGGSSGTASGGLYGGVFDDGAGDGGSSNNSAAAQNSGMVGSFGGPTWTPVTPGYVNGMYTLSTFGNLPFTWTPVLFPSPVLLASNAPSTLTKIKLVTQIAIGVAKTYLTPQCSTLATQSATLGRVSGATTIYTVAEAVTGVGLPATAVTGPVSVVTGSASFILDMASVFHVGCQ